MTEKLFYRDAYINSFTSIIERQEKDENGNYYLVLKETAFYPTGGGQPFDTGTIHNTPVVNVEIINGEIRHYLEHPIPITETEVKGVIDWERRFDHMQQHAGQHILSAAFEELFDYQTISFHLGTRIVTIDLDIPELTDEDAQKAEELANRIILENRPIETKWITSEELTNFPLRKQPTVTEDIRLVIIPEFDYNGCGGTHPNSTGQIGFIKILGWEKQKKKVRLQFVCGKRIISQLHQKQKVLSRLSQLLSAQEEEMVSTVERMIENGKSQEKALDQTRDILLSHEAKDLLQNMNSDHIVGALFTNRSIQELQKLARLVIELRQDVKVTFVSEVEDKLQIVCARGKEGHTSMKNILAELLPLINGKGGGNDSFAQGGGEKIISGEQFLHRILDKM